MARNFKSVFNRANNKSQITAIQTYRGQPKWLPPVVIKSYNRDQTSY
jgi:hypothetical protein